LNTCTAQSTLQQDVEMTCNPRVPQTTPGQVTVYEENTACGQCLEIALKDGQEQDRLERSMWSSSPARVRQPIDSMYAQMIGTIETCGLAYCKACVLTNVTQKSLVSTEANCIEREMTVTNVQANVSKLLQQQFLNNQDVLSATAQKLGIEGVENVSNTIASQISTVVNNTFLFNLQQLINQSQVITLKSATSTNLNNITQSSVLNVVQQAVTENHVSTSAYAESVFEDIALVINQQNTLNEVGEVVFKSTTTFTQAMDSAVGLVMLATLILLGVVVAGVAGFILYRRIKRGVELKQKLQRATELHDATDPAFQDF
jgi:hypothetical protein